MHVNDMEKLNKVENAKETKVEKFLDNIVAKLKIIGHNIWKKIKRLGCNHPEEHRQNVEYISETGYVIYTCGKCGKTKTKLYGKNLTD